MAQNTSSAVMQQRSEPHDSLDDFPTPPWATRALCEHVLMRMYYNGPPHTPDISQLTAWEPACNRGSMAKPLWDYFARVHATDIHDYGYAGMDRTVDFLYPQSESPNPGIVYDFEWIITNPPFRLAADFVRRGLELCPREGVALFVRSAFLEGVGRYNELFSLYPPDVVAQFSERVPIHKGKLTETGSTATSYCWLVWRHEWRNAAHPRFIWIPPCRKELEKEGDYV